MRFDETSRHKIKNKKFQYNIIVCYYIQQGVRRERGPLYYTIFHFDMVIYYLVTDTMLLSSCVHRYVRLK